ncbi:EcsC family protein [Serratia sp. DD3]|uniref:EcsC family protein n=1 Tax=Serratia sp. DD3 TaxID=1410619 RepID=UPI0003C5130D|nr:EcsC family protein [Serratia sp. DD3]KEY59865.1 EcsC protein family protein [Serratia sp. DD3]KEY60199.1 EcsC protein family protein [Serratia sp. DD3]
MHDETSSPPPISRWLEALYTKALQGGPGISSAYQLAEQYRNTFSTPQSAALSLVRWESAKAATSGFMLGVGGIVTLPITLPASLVGPLLLQLRLIAAIALLGGQDVHDLHTRHLVYLCLGGTVAKDGLQAYGTYLFQQISAQALEQVTEKTATHLTTRLAGRLPTAHASHLVPLLSGVVSGSLDYLAVRSAGALACAAFLHKD